MEWLFGFTVLLGIWLSLVTNRVDTGFLKDWMDVILFMPVLLVIVFGVSMYMLDLGYVRHYCRPKRSCLKFSIKYSQHGVIVATWPLTAEKFTNNCKFCISTYTAGLQKEQLQKCIISLIIGVF